MLLLSELPRKGKVNEFVFDDSFGPRVELWSLIPLFYWKYP